MIWKQNIQPRPGHVTLVRELAPWGINALGHRRMNPERKATWLERLRDPSTRQGRSRLSGLPSLPTAVREAPSRHTNVEELRRSPVVDYKRTGSTDGQHPMEHCCLGVLCEAHVADGGLVRIPWLGGVVANIDDLPFAYHEAEKEPVSTGDYSNLSKAHTGTHAPVATDFPPAVTVGWAGLDSQNPLVYDLDDGMLSYYLDLFDAHLASAVRAAGVDSHLDLPVEAAWVAVQAAQVASLELASANDTRKWPFTKIADAIERSL